MTTRHIPRRQLLSDSARLVAVSTATAMLPAAAAQAESPAQSSPRQSPSGQSSSGQASGGPAVRHLNPATLSTPRGYSHAVEVGGGGRTLYISGQISVDKSGTVVGAGNLRAQTQQVFENLKAILDAAGATFADVVKLNIYMLDASQVQVVRDVRDTFVKTDAPPASTLVEIRRLAREELLVEIDAIAHIARGPA